MRSESGQDVVEYAGVLVFVAALIGAVVSLGIGATIARAVQCEVQRIELNSCSNAPAGARSAPPNPTGGISMNAGSLQAAQRALGSNALIDACAGGPQPNEVAESTAADSAACNQQLAKLTRHAVAVLALLAATLQAQEPGNHGNFGLLLQQYLQHPGWAVIALSPRAQAEQAAGNTFLGKLQNTPGDVLDGFLGSLCGGYGLCLGGNAASQAYQEAWHASAQINKLTTPILLATGIAGALKDVAGAGLKTLLAKLGGGESGQLEGAVEELESAKGGAAGAGAGAAPRALAPIAGGAPEDIGISDNAASHIFRRAPGHLAEDTPGNRAVLLQTANNPANLLGRDEFGNFWYAETLQNGSQVWVRVRNNLITNGGVNPTPRTWDPARGLVP